MVNLRENEFVAVRNNQLSRSRPRSRHHNYGVRFGRQREQFKNVPTTLHDLENLAERAVEVMERHGPKSENNLPMVMDLLRLQYNLVSIWLVYMFFILFITFLF